MDKSKILVSVFCFLMVMVLAFLWAVDENLEQITCFYESGEGYTISTFEVDDGKRIDTLGNVRNIDKLLNNDFMYAPIFKKENGTLDLCGDVRIGYHEECIEWW